MEQEKRLCTLIISCNLYKDKWPQVIKMMEDLNNKDYFIVTGDPELPVDYHIIGGRFIFLKCNDYYEGLPEKIVSLYKCVLKDPIFKPYTHFCKVDDTNTFVPNFSFKELEKTVYYDYEGHYLLGTHDFNDKYHFGRCHDPIINRTPYKGSLVNYCSGQIYILSRDAVACFKNVEAKELEGEYYEDLLIAKILAKYFILPHVNKYVRVKVDKEVWGLIIINPNYRP